MNSRNLIGLCLCVGIFLASFAFQDGSSRYLNLVGFLIVVSGTLGATFLSYAFDEIRAAVHVARRAYTRHPPTANEIVATLMNLSLRSRFDGILSLEEAEGQTTVTFLRNALGMMVDGYGVRELRDVLTTEMSFFRERRLQNERTFRHMARLAPAFGVAGSVVGLIAMLAGAGEGELLLDTVPIALTSTLYGIVLSNFILTPVAENIRHKTQSELLTQKIVIEGVVAIMQEQNSHRLERKLQSFMTPSERPRNRRSFEEIRKQYYQRVRDEDLALNRTHSTRPVRTRSSPTAAPPDATP